MSIHVDGRNVHEPYCMEYNPDTFEVLILNRDYKPVTGSAQRDRTRDDIVFAYIHPSLFQAMNLSKHNDTTCYFHTETSTPEEEHASLGLLSSIAFASTPRNLINQLYQPREANPYAIVGGRTFAHTQMIGTVASAVVKNGGTLTMDPLNMLDALAHLRGNACDPRGIQGAIDDPMCAALCAQFGLTMTIEDSMLTATWDYSHIERAVTKLQFIDEGLTPPDGMTFDEYIDQCEAL